MAEAAPAASKTWVRRMAEELAKESEHVSFTAEFVEAILEAAGEVKCVKLKVALARCIETIRHSRLTGEPVDSDENWEKAILELTR